MRMRIATVLFLIAFSLRLAAEPAKAPDAKVQPSDQSVERIVTDDFSKIGASIKELSAKIGVENVLVVLDIDNALITMKGDLGGDAWYNWQEGMVLGKTKPAAPSEVMAKSFYDLLDIQGLFFSLGDMEPTEPAAVKVFQELRKTGHRMMGLTLRGVGFRYDATRELWRNGFNFSKTAPIVPGELPPVWKPYNPLTVRTDYGFSEAEAKDFSLSKPAREVSYLWGVMFVEGQHKGAMLRIFLKKAGLKPKAIVFVDDNLKHVERVEAAMKGKTEKVLTFHYTKMASRVKKFEEKGKPRVLRQWTTLEEAFDSGDPRLIRKRLRQIFRR